ncbi:MAG: Lytic transglycosylase2C catalytic [Candidatus Amesbacteria bacterium GW2011_GWB1_47_26]|uniref:Lytic transglycosylase2C catalytic n=1 Tax=Candidatus Amesbacteria bacterium GW2011_GWC2_45_19 TaxID=1618366 RepID=A0A0G1M454_9BACT|nr:MAG: Lytic transglycosylase2C catalytic [Candidatus Amesbacteria bacterium GW2011_GWC2_45_19]KKU38515.1 MAG: Lytic transglycosylase2C catalytic [Candidatus Amesbacteria bacterium GW2011_GWA1_46_35]KKU69196.1 MAG: Lytic transglycosylase2C catalytic [Microgenomates group bacterium GW2011_GWC1_47_20]KKU74683.1 MAG: Lytic transglycosylase2C catalytic [Candidatus Amesbacteria bacterium GW2011_GWB1_47_26]KKU80129.1 MAG: Lytic transglycosylase2C catalytic [Candidatus Amesbacteria bacterium GW2011_G
MRQVLVDKRRRIIRNEEEVRFSSPPALHFIVITARVKSEKQISTKATDDEDLIIKIDNKVFPYLTDSTRLVDSPAAFSGGQLHNLLKTIYFLTFLEGKDHTIIFSTDKPDNTAVLENLEVYSLDQTDELVLEIENQAEDGDRRPWITYVLVDLSLKKFSPVFVLKRRFIDSDDVKVIVDGEVKRNNRSLLHKFWYFIASRFGGETQKEVFAVELPPQLHYIEFWADRMPTLKSITFSGIKKVPTETIEKKIVGKAQTLGLDPELMLRIAKRESQFNPRATSPKGAKGIYQLTDITIKQIEKLGFVISDPYDIDQNITGGMMYFKWLYELYEGKTDRLEKTLAAWNWGLANFSREKPLNWKILPAETREFIRYVTGK